MEDIVAQKFWYRLLVANDVTFNAGINPMVFDNDKILHLTNNFLGYIFCRQCVLHFNLILTKTLVESVPKETSGAAEIDGAGTI